MRRFTLLFLALALVAPGVIAEPAITIRAVELKAKAASDAKTIASLPTNTTVDLIKREGAWVELKSGKDRGWAKLFDIRLASAQTAPSKSSSNTAFSDTVGLLSGARGASVTTGVRGLDEDMLKRAVPNEQQYNLLVSYASTKQQAQAFGKAGHLESRTVEELK
jgi:hypothetical protein